MVEWIKK